MSRHVRFAVAAGLALVAVALAVVLANSGHRLAGTNGRGQTRTAEIPPGRQLCQRGEPIPDHSGELVLTGAPGSPPAGPLTVSVRSARGAQLARGHVAAPAPPALQHVQLTPAVAAVTDATVCIRNDGRNPLMLLGEQPDVPAHAGQPTQAPATVNGFSEPAPTLLAFTWYRPGSESLASLLGTVADRFGLMKASFLGAWTLWAVLALMALLAAASVALLRDFGEPPPEDREPAPERPPSEAGGRGRPLVLNAAAGGLTLASAAPARPAWLRRLSVPWRGARPLTLTRLRMRVRPVPALAACVLIAAGNAAVWSILTPSFQGPDELVHVAYVQYLAETGRVPRPLTPFFNASPDLLVPATGVPFSLTDKPSWLPAHDAALRAQVGRRLPRVSEAGVAYAASNPPLYYALDAIPYRLASHASFLNRLFFMRLLSALLAGVTVGFVFAFMRELLPRSPWAWTAGALAVAFQPVFAFVGGVVSNDDLLFAAGAALLWLIARAFRRGLTPKLGAAIGLAVVVGLLSKGSMLGLIPGTGVALLLSAWRTERSRRLAAFAAAVLAGTVVVALEGAWLFADQHLFGRAATTTATNLNTSSWYSAPLVREQLSYLWQFFFPRLPSMIPQFKVYPTYPLWQDYFQGFVGRFGWFQWDFPLWVDWLALAIWVPLFALAIRALVSARAAVRRRWPELVSYATLAAGIVLLVGIAGYRYRKGTQINFEQPRYLFPVIALYAALVACVARGFGRRLAPAAAAFLVVLAIGHNLLAEIASIARYYT